MKILLATHNPAKIKSYTQKLDGLGIDFMTLNDLGITERFTEDKNTFEENARDKAFFYFGLAKMPTIAEDGGFEIDYLNKEPGVKSRRWLGFEATDQQIVARLHEVIPAIPQDQRTARFVAVTCFIKDPERVYLIRNTKEGCVTEDIRETFPAGFPYRSCFVSGVFNKHVEDLTEEETLTISHRFKNIQELKKYLLN